MTAPPTGEDMARNLSAYLTQTPGYGRNSPLDEMLQAQITQLTREIAREVIAATPELRDYVKVMVERTVKQALAQDGWLNQTVVGAVSKAITDLALERKAADS